jgi:hypothetical protein
MKVDRGRLWVAGGGTGMAFVYDASSGADVTSYQLSTGGSFINDVVVTKRAAWFTDSFAGALSSAVGERRSGSSLSGEDWQLDG